MKKYYIIGFFACTALCIALYMQENKTNTIENKISSIPKNDRIVLEEFFRFLYSQGCFVDVIYGDKPMASVDYNVFYTAQISRDETYKKNMQLCIKGWKTWKNYSHLFPMNKYYFFSTEFSNGDQCHCFVLVNIDRCQKIMNKYPEIYDSFGLQKNVISLIEHLATAKEKVTKDRLQYHQALGLLYGYGLKNVNNFVRKIALERQITLAKSEKSKQAPVRRELEVLKKKMTFTKGSKNSQYPIQHSGCISIDPETRIVKLHKKPQELVEIFHSKKFLQKFLEALCK